MSPSELIDQFVASLPKLSSWGKPTFPGGTARTIAVVRQKAKVKLLDASQIDHLKSLQVEWDNLTVAINRVTDDAAKTQIQKSERENLARASRGEPMVGIPSLTDLRARFESQRRTLKDRRAAICAEVSAVLATGLPTLADAATGLADKVEAEHHDLFDSWGFDVPPCAMAADLRQLAGVVASRLQSANGYGKPSDIWAGWF